MNRFVISIFLTMLLCLSVSLAFAGGATSPGVLIPDVINPGAQGVGRQDVLNPGPGNSCNARDGFVYLQYNGKGMCVRCAEKNGYRYAKYNGKDSCVRCDEKSGWRYAKYNGKDACVRCDEKNGWRYDGNKSCVK